MQCSTCQKSSGDRAPGEGFGKGVPSQPGEATGKRAMPPPQKIVILFHFKIVHSGALSYTNSEVLFAIKCRKGTSSRYSWRLTVIQT